MPRLQAIDVLSEAVSASRSFAQVALRPVVRPLSGFDRARRNARAQILDAAERATLVVLDATVFSQLAEDVLEQALASPGFDRLIERVLESASIKRLVAQVIDSAIFDEAIRRLLESDDLWLLVDEIARSPSVTDAISHQSTSFAGQVVDVFRARSSTADERLERLARRMLHRHQRADPGMPELP